MKRLDPNKLTVEIRQPDVTLTDPTEPRRYTLTHSDTSGNLCLVIGSDYAYDKIGPQRDEILSEWRLNNHRYYLYVHVDVDNPISPMASAVRYIIFRRELLLSLEAIHYGDRAFFKAHPDLARAPIWVYFDSNDPYYNGIELWGTISDYQCPPIPTG